MKCSQCGVCCKLFLINLTEKEYKSGKYKTQFEEFGLTEDFQEAEMCGANIITQQKDGSCYYLMDGKCSIHNKRPEACRAFFCKSDNPKFKEMIDRMNKYRQKQQSSSHI
ncbi:MAG: YkgJ family cysteine cluster protein [Nanoarchaeota archaeon]|nr:YkgJ family cysteine cluster protein [Nanoarchaeota archaeon]